MKLPHVRITSRRNACFVLLGLGLLLGSACTATPQASPTPGAPVEDPSLSASAVLNPTLPVTTASPSPAPTATPAPAPALCSPLAVQPLEKLGEIITQPFSMPRVLADGTYKDDAHHGVDLGYYTRNGKKFTGTPVLAAMDGKIAAVIHDRPPYGNMLMLETPFERIPAWIIASQKIPRGDSLYSLYAHLQNLQPLAIGQAIKCGQPLAETGLTGFTGGPHLHFETRWGPADTNFPEMAFYRADATPDELKNYTLWRMSGRFHLFDPMELLAP
jgi:murein DD-endopeptidase MepM/ murein hydrolase activator NlpD